MIIIEFECLLQCSIQRSILDKCSSPKRLRAHNGDYTKANGKRPKITRILRLLQLATKPVSTLLSLSRIATTTLTGQRKACLKEFVYFVYYLFYFYFFEYFCYKLLSCSTLVCVVQ